MKKKISGLDDPQNDSDAANKKYVQNVLLLDGSKAMTGNFDMGNKDIVNANKIISEGNMICRGNLTVNNNILVLKSIS